MDWMQLAMRQWLSLWLFGGAALLPTAAAPPETPASASAPEEAAAPDFGEAVYPLLKKYCVGCHLPEDPQGGLVMASFETLAKGGLHGAAFVPGNAAASRMVQMVDGSLKPTMPPKDNPAPTMAEWQIVRAWIDAGALPPKQPVNDGPNWQAPFVAPKTTPAHVVQEATLSPDGRWLALGGFRRILLCEVSTQQIIREWRELSGPVNALQFSADSSRLFAGSGEPGAFGELVCYEVATGNIVYQKRGHQDNLFAIALSPDGFWLATGGYGPKIELWEAATGEPLATLNGHNEGVFSLAFRLDSKILASASADRTVKLWDMESLERLDTFSEPLRDLYALAFHPNGNWLAAGGRDNRVRLWQVSKTGQEGSNQILHSLFAHEGAVVRLAFSPNGQFLASAAEDRTVKVWDANAMKELFLLEEQPAIPTALCFDPQSEKLLVGRLDGSLTWYQIATNADHGPTPGAVVSQVIPRLPEPKFTAVHPAFVVRGQSAQLTVHGEHFSDTVQPVLDVPSVQVTVVERQAQEFKLTVDIPKEFTAKELPLRLQRDNWQSEPFQLTVLEKMPEKPVVEKIVPGRVNIYQGGTLVLEGKNLAPSPTAVIAGEHFAVAVTHHEGGNPEKLHLQLTPKRSATPSAPDPVPAEVMVQVTTFGGTSDARPLRLDDAPQVEAEPNDLLHLAQTVTMERDCWGVLQQHGDADHFQLDLTPGKTVVFDLQAQRLGGQLDGTLTLFEAGGRLVAHNNDWDDNPDPLLTFTPSQAGRYILKVGDQQRQGSTTHFYRLSITTQPFVTAVYPLAVEAGGTRSLQLIGYNLPTAATVVLETPPPAQVRPNQQMTVPLGAFAAHTRREFKVDVVTTPVVVEQEPNDHYVAATPLTVPGVAVGRIAPRQGQTRLQFTSTEPMAAPKDNEVAADLEDAADAAAILMVDQDHFRFFAEQGTTLVLETKAARSQSPIDTRLDILDATTGTPVPQVFLQAVRDSMINFRNIPSDGGDVRIDNWEEMELNEFLYFQGEVVKIFRMPQGPDSGIQFYALNGKRLNYFHTTATAHALHDPCYVVHPYPPGSTIIPNGLPIFELSYTNDDASNRTLGRDSYILFTAPQSADYVVRVTDSRQEQSEQFNYQLLIRPAQPDFQVSLNKTKLNFPEGGGAEVQFKLQRQDGFDGPVQIEITGLPEGLQVSQPLWIEAGHYDADAAFFPTAKPETFKDFDWQQVKFTAVATIAGAAVRKPFAQLQEVRFDGPPQLVVRLEPAVISIQPGSTTTVQLKVQRRQFDGRITFDVPNLPHGVIVDNIGLNGILIPEGDSERTMYLKAANWVQPMARPFFAVSQEAGRQVAPPIVLQVESGQ